MALSGELSDLSLAELIEFFGNLRKTGRLKVEFAEGPGLFYFREGNLVDAQVGHRVGPEAVYHALSMPNAAFDFNPRVYASRQTINEPWMRLVLEGLRRVDEGIPPEHINTEDEQQSGEAESKFHQTAGEPSISEVVAYMDDLYRLEDGTWAITSAADPSHQAINKPDQATVLPLSTTTARASAGHRRRFALFAAIGAFLVCGTAVGALTNWFGKGKASTASPITAGQLPVVQTGANTSQSALSESNANLGNIVAGNSSSEQQTATSEKRAASALKANAAAARSGALTPASKEERPATATGSKTVMVQVTVNEDGRVSQASVSNSRPGMESYEATALRIARQRRYPAGKSGVISVPVKIN